MKKLLLLPVLLAIFLAGALAKAPEPLNDFDETLSAASKDEKLAFVLLGRPACSICNGTKAMIKEGKIAVTSADYVMGDLNIDDPKTNAEFMLQVAKTTPGGDSNSDK